MSEFLLSPWQKINKFVLQNNVIVNLEQSQYDSVSLSILKANVGSNQRYWTFFLVNVSFGDLTSMHKLIKTSINLINCSTEQILTMSQNQLTRTDTFIWSVIIVIISNGNKLEIAANQMNLNTNLDLSRDYWIKIMWLVTSSNSFPYLSNTKMPIMPISGISKKLS